MAGKRQANGTSFKPGAKPGPGRPKGSKNVTPSVRDLVNAVVEAHLDPVKEAYRKAAVNPRSVLQALDLKARVNKEIGQGSGEAGVGGITISFISNVRPEKLAAARSRALPLQAKVVG